MIVQVGDKEFLFCSKNGNCLDAWVRFQAGQDFPCGSLILENQR